jgi:enoyl-CoA hydratase
LGKEDKDMSRDETSSFVVTQDGQVARIRCLPFGSGTAEPHWELATILDRLQFDNSVRVVVIRGADDETFLAPKPAGPGKRGPVYRSPEWLWRVSTGIVRVHELLATLDKPVVASVHGDAIGIGASLVFAADFAVAWEDARIADVHMGMGETEPYHWTTGVVPGDGGVSLVPLFLPPALAKEFLLLARPLSASELFRLGAINHAVPRDKVTEITEELVAALLRRPSYALAWTKRVANKHVVEQLHRTLDAGVAYELINMLQYVAEGGDCFEL